MAVMYLPLVPQENQREGKYHPQYGAANIVHEVFVEEEADEEEEGGGTCRENNRNARGSSCGTGSCPPSHQG